MLNVALIGICVGIFSPSRHKPPKYLNTDKEQSSGRGTLMHQFLPGKHHWIHLSANPGATGTSCGDSPGVPRDSAGISDTWGGRSDPRNVLSS